LKPEQIAQTQPINAGGAFELDPQAELLAPFEGTGVDTNWELSLPRIANPFDFGTIADVVFTIEFTALDEFDYRRQVIKQLEANRRFTAERAFSFRFTFADQWYDLHNADLLDGDERLVVTFETSQADFTPLVACGRHCCFETTVLPTGEKLPLFPEEAKFIT
jgi:hypothetical protein